MNELAYAGVMIAVVAGIVLAILHFWRRKRWEGSLLLFFLPVLAYFLWHFSVEAYSWGEIWATALEQSLELNIAVALVDLKLIATIFMLLFWVYVWNSVNAGRGGSKGH